MILKNKGDICQLDYAKALVPGTEMVISLKWTNGSGLMKRIMGQGALDIDLGCYYEMDNGEKLLIDALQFSEDYGGREQKTRQGCFVAPPYIWHCGDNRGMGRESIETILVNPLGLNQLRRLMIYAYVYDGSPRWAEAQATLEISLPGYESTLIEVNTMGSERFCAIASIDVNPEDSCLVISKLDTFHSGHSTCDRVYGWGFTYHKEKLEIR